jgi:hypothetical protein
MTRIAPDGPSWHCLRNAGYMFQRIAEIAGAA